MGFVRNTLRARDETTQQFKCDLIIGVPRGYDLTATTRPYLHSTYALVVRAACSPEGRAERRGRAGVAGAAKRAVAGGRVCADPAADWVLKNELMEHAVIYAPQSGDPNETPDTIVERDLTAGTIDAAILWGPIAGYLVSRHGGPGAQGWVVLPFAADPHIRFDYEISMGVRPGEQPWLDTLNVWIEAHQRQIEQILDDYHVPRVTAPAAPSG